MKQKKNTQLDLLLTNEKPNQNPSKISYFTKHSNKIHLKMSLSQNIQVFFFQHKKLLAKFWFSASFSMWNFSPSSTRHFSISTWHFSSSYWFRSDKINTVCLQSYKTSSSSSRFRYFNVSCRRNLWNLSLAWFEAIRFRCNSEACFSSPSSTRRSNCRYFDRNVSLSEKLTRN